MSFSSLGLKPLSAIFQLFCLHILSFIKKTFCGYPGFSRNKSLLYISFGYTLGSRDPHWQSVAMQAHYLQAFFPLLYFHYYDSVLSFKRLSEIRCRILVESSNPGTTYLLVYQSRSRGSHTFIITFSYLVNLINSTIYFKLYFCIFSTFVDRDNSARPTFFLNNWLLKATGNTLAALFEQSSGMPQQLSLNDGATTPIQQAYSINEVMFKH